MMDLSPGRGLCAESTPEMVFICAVLSQALHDMTAPHPAVRAEAEQFWQDADAVRPWADLLEVDASALMAAVRRRRGQAFPTESAETRHRPSSSTPGV